MKLLVKIILSAMLVVSFAPSGFAASQIIHVDEVIKNLSKIKAPAKKRYPKKKKVAKKKVTYGPTKKVVSFSTKYKPGTLITKIQHDFKLTVLIVSHNPTEMLDFADEITLIADGTIVIQHRLSNRELPKILNQFIHI